MRKQPSRALEQLIEADIAPRRARRILREFAEHQADLVAERLSLGDSASNAQLAWLLPCGVAALLAIIAARSREPSIWPCIGIAAVCFVGALTNFSVSL